MLGIPPEALGIIGLQLMRQANGNQQSQPNYGLLMASLLNGASSNQMNEMSSANQMPQVTQLANESLTNPVGTRPQPIMQPTMPMGGDNPYFSQLKQAAMNAYPNNPTMQQVAMSQAILESGVHPSALARNNNNYFGIKSPNGVSMATQEYVNGRPVTEQASFATNPSMQASFDQHRGLLNRPRYEQVISSTSPESAFVALQRAGYATDPRYAAKLSNVYNRYVQPLYY